MEVQERGCAGGRRGRPVAGATRDELQPLVDLVRLTFGERKVKNTQLPRCAPCCTRGAGTEAREEVTKMCVVAWQLRHVHARQVSIGRLTSGVVAGDGWAGAAVGALGGPRRLLRWVPRMLSGGAT